MKERPILFSAPMVRALLDGSKTQTRRVCKPMQQWVDQDCREVRLHEGSPHHFLKGAVAPLEKLRCPYGQDGDRLWVRETWADLEQITDGSFARQAIYRADDIERYGNEDEYVDVTSQEMRWRPSIHMPRWASRILLEIVSVRVERLQDISDADARAEGIDQCDGLGKVEDILDLAKRMGGQASPSVLRYATLWASINGAGSWDANPWVWCITFRRVLP